MPAPAFNKRQLLYRQYRLEGMTGKAAALKAGYSISTANSRKTTMPDMATCLEKMGLSDTVIARKVVEGTEAENNKGNPDYYARHKYLVTAAQLKGHLIEKTATNIDKMQVNVYLPQPLPVVPVDNLNKRAIE